ALEAVAEGLKTELAPFGIKVATVNPGFYGTGFNDRGVEAAAHWYDPTKNFTSQDAFSAAAGLLAHQLDPQAIADLIVEVALSGNASWAISFTTFRLGRAVFRIGQRRGWWANRICAMAVR